MGRFFASSRPHWRNASLVLRLQTMGHETSAVWSSLRVVLPTLIAAVRNFRVWKLGEAAYDAG